MGQVVEPADPLAQLKQLVASLTAVQGNPKAAEVADALSNLVPVLLEAVPTAAEPAGVSQPPEPVAPGGGRGPEAAQAQPGAAEEPAME
eukprot:1869106-Pyramimonas_sp.AAC.1